MLHNYIAFGNLSTKFQTIFFLRKFSILIKVALRMLEIAFRGPKFQNFLGEDTPGPPTYVRFWSYASASPLAGSAPGHGMTPDPFW